MKKILYCFLVLFFVLLSAMIVHLIFIHSEVQETGNKTKRLLTELGLPVNGQLLEEYYNKLAKPSEKQYAITQTLTDEIFLGQGVFNDIDDNFIKAKSFYWNFNTHFEKESAGRKIFNKDFISKRMPYFEEFVAGNSMGLPFDAVRKLYTMVNFRCDNARLDTSSEIDPCRFAWVIFLCDGLSALKDNNQEEAGKAYNLIIKTENTAGSPLYLYYQREACNALQIRMALFSRMINAKILSKEQLVEYRNGLSVTEDEYLSRLKHGIMLEAATALLFFNHSLVAFNIANQHGSFFVFPDISELIDPTEEKLFTRMIDLRSYLCWSEKRNVIAAQKEYIRFFKKLLPKLNTEPIEEYIATFPAWSANIRNKDGAFLNAHLTNLRNRSYNVCRAIAYLRMARIICDIEIYRIDSDGKIPENLNAVYPKLNAPKDPFSSVDFRYIVNTDKSLSLQGPSSIGITPLDQTVSPYRDFNYFDWK